MPRAGKLVAAALAAFGVPAAAAAFWRDTLKRRPGVAVVLALAYWAVVGAVAVAAKVMARPADRRMEQLGEAVDRALGRRLSRYGRRYREHVATSLRLVDDKGMATVGPHTPELDEVFVDVRLAPRPPHQVSGGVLADAPGDVTHRYCLSDLLDRDKPAARAVIGAPGSGKTTLLRHVARQYAQTRRRPVPILLELRDHAEQVAASPPATLPQVLRARLADLQAREPEGWWEHQLSRGACLVLLDGLDEVARAEDRRAVADWIGRQITRYPRNDYVVTSRPHGYRTAAIAQVGERLQVCPFTDEQVRRFLRNWYLAAERHAASRPGPDVDRRARDGAADLLDRLAKAPAIQDLTANPLLLTMIANVHRYRRALPGSRADLYGEACQAMLWRRQEAKNLPVDMSGASKERLLATLAYTMMRRRVRDLSREQVLHALRPGLRRVSKDATAEGFLADVGNNGLLVERERDLFAFAHHTFGEYLAARHIKDNGLVRDLTDAVDDVWWRETTLFYAAADADQIVRACLDAGTSTALALAFDCADGGELAPDLRDQLEKTLAEAFDDDADPGRRRLVAAVLATRHLRRFVRTAVGARVCPQPVPADLYWLFLQDTHTPAPDGPTPLAPDPGQPAAGLWGADALAFVAWVNTLAAGANEPICRLPTRAELQDLRS